MADEHDMSPFAGVTDLVTMNQLTENMTNLGEWLSSRSAQWLNRLMDPRRSIADECGFPRNNSITAQQWQEQFDRNPAAARCVELMSKESFQRAPVVYENERTKVVTPFEKAVNNLGRNLRGQAGWFQDQEGSALWSHVLNADILSGIGRFGAIFLGINDGATDLSLPAPGWEEQNSSSLSYNHQTKQYSEEQPRGRYKLTINKEKQDGVQLIWMREFSETCLMISRWESNPSSPRFGHPNEYLVTFFDPNESYTGIGLNIAMKRVHHSRMVHLSDWWHQAATNWYISAPRCRPVLNNLLNLEKVYGASAEGYWKMCMAILAAETHQTLGGDVDVDDNAMRDMFENMMNGLQRYGTFKGMSLKSVGPTISDPKTHIDINLEAICYKIGVPLRIFKGSERGGDGKQQEDDAKFNDRLKHRQIFYNTPSVVAPLFDRLIQLGALPQPGKAGQKPRRTMFEEGDRVAPDLRSARSVNIETEGGYSVYWPDITSQSAQEKATVFSTRMGAFAQITGPGNITELIDERDILVREASFTEDEADAILEARQKKQEKDMQDADDLGHSPKPAPGFEHAPKPPMNGKPPKAGAKVDAGEGTQSTDQPDDEQDTDE